MKHKKGRRGRKQPENGSDSKRPTKKKRQQCSVLQFILAITLMVVSWFVLSLNIINKRELHQPLIHLNLNDPPKTHVASLNMTHHPASSKLPIEDTAKQKQETKTLTPQKTQQQNRRIVPNYKLAKQRPASDDVSILTQMTLDRFPALVAMAKVWQGPMSVVIYLYDDQMAELQKKLKRNQNILLPDHQPSIDFHLWIQYRNSTKNNAQYPVNHLRNLAIDHCSTDYIIMLDVDFIPSIDMYSELHRLRSWKPPSSDKHIDNNDNKVALIVPAFEIISNVRFPQTRIEVMAYRQRFRKPLIQQIHLMKGGPAHNATNYQKWYSLPVSPHLKNNKNDDALIYHVEYEYLFEPYFMINKHFAPKYDERFIGYGNDKASYTYELIASGFDMYVLPRPFITHKDHGTPEWRKHGQGSKQAWQRWAMFCNDISDRYNNFRAPVPAWLKDRCTNHNECPKFWEWFTTTTKKQ